MSVDETIQILKDLGDVDYTTVYIKTAELLNSGKITRGEFNLALLKSREILSCFK